MSSTAAFDELLDRGDQVFRGSFAHAFEIRQPVGPQGVQIGGIPHEAALDKLDAGEFDALVVGNQDNRAFCAGANILMPNVTATRYRRGYQLYDGKPGLDESTEISCLALERSVTAVGESIGYRRRGTSPAAGAPGRRAARSRRRPRHPAAAERQPS